MNIQFAFGSDKGCVRAQNEDAYAVLQSERLWVVADGMGGHNAGEVASQVAVDTIVATFAQERALDSAILQAHQAICAQAQQNPVQKGMGATVVALHLGAQQYQVAWAGDSRAYMWHQDKLKLLTTDHSFVQQLVSEHLISAEQARKHPQRNLVTNVLGGYGREACYVSQLTGILPCVCGFLLCSDGVSEELSHVQLQVLITQAIAEGVPPSELVRQLIQQAKQEGGKDNLTACWVWVQR